MKPGRIVVLALLSIIGAQGRHKEARRGPTCRLAGKAQEECRQDFGNSTGGTPMDKVKERFEIGKGATVALGVFGMLENCTRDIAATSGTFEDCKAQVETALQLLKNDTLSDGEVEREIGKIAAEKAEHIIRTCSEAATSNTAKEACLAAWPAEKPCKPWPRCRVEPSTLFSGRSSGSCSDKVCTAAAGESDTEKHVSPLTSAMPSTPWARAGRS